MPSLICASPTILDQSFPRDEEELQTVAIALGELQDFIEKDVTHLILTDVLRECFVKKKQYHYKESGLDNVYLEGVDIFSCPSCNEEPVSVPAVPELHSLTGKHLTEKKSLLNGKEIRFLRKT